jgi:hypothetical protein
VPGNADVPLEAPVAQFRSRQNCSVNLIVLGNPELRADIRAAQRWPARYSRGYVVVFKTTIIPGFGKPPTGKQMCTNGCHLYKNGCVCLMATTPIKLIKPNLV